MGRVKKNCHICGSTEKTVFGFPRNSCKKQERWLSFCQKKGMNELRWPFLCCIHFDEQFIIRNARSVRLSLSAVPTLEPPKDSSVSENSSHNACERPRSPSTSFELANKMKVKWNELLRSMPAESISSLSRNAPVSEESTHQDTTPVQIESTNSKTCTPTQVVNNETTTPCFNLCTPVLESTTPDKVANNETTTTPHCRRRLSLRYLGDIDTPLLESPSTRSQCLAVIRYQNKVMLKKMKRLKEQNKRLTQKVASLKQLLKGFSELAKKDLTEASSKQTGAKRKNKASKPGKVRSLTVTGEEQNLYAEN